MNSLIQRDIKLRSSKCNHGVTILRLWLISDSLESWKTYAKSVPETRRESGLFVHFLFQWIISELREDTDETRVCPTWCVRYCCLTLTQVEYVGNIEWQWLKPHFMKSRSKTLWLLLAENNGSIYTCNLSSEPQTFVKSENTGLHFNGELWPSSDRYRANLVRSPRYITKFKVAPSLHYQIFV